ncbi:hypothetical protein [Chryseobacterium chendengshani]|uniref:hypothetical protein n=1 Tax=Chryseobacterium sp. LJ756 TaxID=2864113 RepID=UPI001C6432A1|nr:hypothetical protein [Chryseobacterium sp. LJ756]MBW7676862.1 hypothetical protein [Chryseobacterium sp. LJ756]
MEFKMKKLIFILFLNLDLFVFAQNCKYLVTVNADNLKETGKFKLMLKNIDGKFFKIPKEINFCNMRLVDLEFYNEITQSFKKMELSNKDIDCFTYKDKDIKLKPNKIYVYNVNIKSDFEVIQSSKFFEIFNDRKYRFKISFYLDSYIQCGESNRLVTDWIYKN